VVFCWGESWAEVSSNIPIPPTPTEHSAACTTGHGKGASKSLGATDGLALFASSAGR
jgi:ApbE superfamily uncharacterized protein (UPF0280 family)